MAHYILIRAINEGVEITRKEELEYFVRGHELNLSFPSVIGHFLMLNHCHHSNPFFKPIIVKILSKKEREIVYIIK